MKFKLIATTTKNDTNKIYYRQQQKTALHTADVFSIEL